MRLKSKSCLIKNEATASDRKLDVLKPWIIIFLSHFPFGLKYQKLLKFFLVRFPINFPNLKQKKKKLKILRHNNFWLVTASLLSFKVFDLRIFLTGVVIQG